MPTVTFQMIHSGEGAPQFSVEVAAGTTLLDAARACNLPLEHACEGYCACATCHVILLEGGESVAPSTAREEDMLDCAWDATLGSRLSCQVRVGSEPLRVLIPRYSLNSARMVRNFPEIWNPPKVEEASQKSKSCSGCCCSKKATSVEPLKWDNAAELAQLLYEAQPECDPSTLRFTELHQRICGLPAFKDAPEKSSEAKLEAILQAWLNLQADLA